MVDDEVRKTLEFLRNNKAWVLNDIPNQNQSEVLTLPLIPNETGIYWIAGQSSLRSGRVLESVFRVDTNAGGSLAAVFWRVDGNWYRHEDADVLVALGMMSSDVFPFDWSYSIPLEKDIFHP